MLTRWSDWVRPRQVIAELVVRSGSTSKARARASGAATEVWLGSLQPKISMASEISGPTERKGVSRRLVQPPPFGGSPALGSSRAGRAPGMIGIFRTEEITPGRSTDSLSTLFDSNAQERGGATERHPAHTKSSQDGCAPGFYWSTYNLGSCSRSAPNSRNRSGAQASRMLLQPNTWASKDLRPYRWTPQTKFAIPLGSSPPTKTIGSS
jgi:hypothetical protein